MRAVRSAAPPVVKVTMIFIGLVGHDCAAGAEDVAAIQAHRTAMESACSILSVLFGGECGRVLTSEQGMSIRAGVRGFR